MRVEGDPTNLARPLGWARHDFGTEPLDEMTTLIYIGLREVSSNERSPRNWRGRGLAGLAPAKRQQIKLDQISKIIQKTEFGCCTVVGRG
jgi:hypothetical protein